MQDVNWHPVNPVNFNKGMVVFKEPRFSNHRSDIVTVGEFKGQCDQGFHFGSHCFGKISTWWIPEKRG